MCRRHALIRRPSAILVTTREAAGPLSQLAEIQVANGARLCASREQRYPVRTNARAATGRFVADAQRRFARDVALPAGYQVDWGGHPRTRTLRRRLAFILPVTIAVIFALLFTFG